jgi:triosephosphate isomerase
MAKIIVANWKMNPSSLKEADTLLSMISKNIGNIKNNKIIICLPFPFLYLFKKYKNKKIILGAQNASCYPEGSFTGEVSPKMLIEMGVKNVIVGHSERRAQGEDNKIINQKILNLLKFKINPILCVGETNRDKEGSYLSFIENQIKECLVGISKKQINNIIIAYEPIWAIGATGIRVATKEEFIEIKIFIKKIISDIYDSKIAHSIPIIYGGSVNYLNSKSFTEEGGADGLLVGRDSLNFKKFSAILETLN